ncbi:MAG: PRC-barrel domain-containing protein [Gammaproteobacteria bacterium]
MLSSVKELENCTVSATDGTIGSVQDFYFDDEGWVIRYLVIDTGTWLAHRKVLISPHSIRDAATADRLLSLSVTKQQVEHSPAIDTDKPVSRQHERSYLGYYGYPYYWGGAGLWGGGAFPGMTLGGVVYTNAQPEIDAEQQQRGNLHLRSCNEVASYYLHASDGEIGHVQGFLIDKKSWAIRFLIVNTSNWWMGHRVLIAPEWIRDVSWSQSMVTTDLTRQAVKESPVYDPGTPLHPAAEAAIYKHYGRSAYGEHPAKRKVA